jgi:integrase/recombinase XerD
VRLVFFYGVTLGRLEIRRGHTWPGVDQVVRFLEAVLGLKNRAALTTACAAGLHVSEVVVLKGRDIASKRMVIRIERSKSGEERYVMLSVRLLRILRTYCWLARPLTGLLLPISWLPHVHVGQRATHLGRRICLAVTSLWLEGISTLNAARSLPRT